MPERPVSLDSIPHPVWKRAVRRAQLLTPLCEADHCSLEQIDQVARRLKVSRASVYRLLGRFKGSREAVSLLPTKPGLKCGTKKLSPEQEKIIDNLIESFYLSRQRPSVAALHRTVAVECFQTSVEVPSYTAVRARIKSLKRHDLVQARDGAKAAAQFQPLKGSLTAREPLEMVQIDHTLVDVIVVDEWNRQPIGRPWLSLAIDVATRTVPGFFLSLRPPSATSTALTISRAVLRKESFLAARQIDVTWPIYGLPRTIHLDNAKEFHARALVRGCEQHGIEIIHRPPLQPQYGGHIERLIGTLMGEVHLLPGTTFSSVAQRGSYDSARQATMTLDELETWLVWQIAGIYHQRSHAALRRAPVDAWNEGVQRMSKPLREPAHATRFYLDFLPFEKRTVGRDGVRLFNVLYWHGALSRCIHDGKSYIVKYDPGDLSRVYLWEETGSYLEIPYRDLAHGPTTLREVQNGARALRTAGESVLNEKKLFQTIQNQRALLATAKEKTLKARRQVQQRAERKPILQNVARQQPVEDPGPEEPVDPFPFEIWHG